MEILESDNALKTLGMVQATTAQVAEALKELVPEGADKVDWGAVIRAVFLRLRRHKSTEKLGGKKVNYLPISPLHPQLPAKLLTASAVYTIKKLEKSVADSIPVGTEESSSLANFLDANDFTDGSCKGFHLSVRDFSRWFTRAIASNSP